MSTELLIVLAVICWFLWSKFGVPLTNRGKKLKKMEEQALEKEERFRLKLEEIEKKRREEDKRKKEAYLKSPEGLVKQAFDKANRLHIFDLLSVFTNHRNALSFNSSEEKYPIEILSSERIKPTDPVPLNYDESQFKLYEQTFLHFSFNDNTFSIGQGDSLTYTPGYSDGRIFLFFNGELKMSPKLIKKIDYYTINKSDRDLDQVIKLDNWITEVKPLRDEIETARKNDESNQKKLLRKATKDKIRRNIDLGD